MPADCLYDDADVELVRGAIADCRYDDMSDEQARAVLETLTAAGSPLLARHRAQVAEEIAQAIEALAPSPEFAEAARIAREMADCAAPGCDRPIPVRRLGYAARVNVDPDGTPRCNCCADRMVQVKPDQWMCQLGAAGMARAQELLADTPHLGEALGG